MRVPVYPEDLLPRAAFKKLAKSIQKRWPGNSPVQLTPAQKTLSKGLGYANYHDLTKESVICPRDAERPTLRAVHAQVAAAISSLLDLANDTSVPRNVLDAFVDTLPLKSLRTFKGAASRGVEVEVEVEVEVTKSRMPDFNQAELCHVNTTPSKSEAPSYTHPPITYTRPPITHKRSRRHASPLGLDVFTHIDAIKQIVENSGSLRDRSLFALLEKGLRMGAILDAKVSQVVSLDAYRFSSKEMPIEITKAKPPQPLAYTAVIENYISAKNLSADDYLFPGDDPTHPMLKTQVLQIFRSWERQAQLPSSTLTPSTLRLVAVARLVASTSTRSPVFERVADQLNHSSSSTKHYVSLTATGADAPLKSKR